MGDLEDLAVEAGQHAKDRGVVLGPGCPWRQGRALGAAGQGRGLHDDAKVGDGLDGGGHSVYGGLRWRARPAMCASQSLGGIGRARLWGLL